MVGAGFGAKNAPFKALWTARFLKTSPKVSGNATGRLALHFFLRSSGNPLLHVLESFDNLRMNVVEGSFLLSTFKVDLNPGAFDVPNGTPGFRPSGGHSQKWNSGELHLCHLSLGSCC